MERGQEKKGMACVCCKEELGFVECDWTKTNMEWTKTSDALYIYLHIELTINICYMYNITNRNNNCKKVG